MDGLSWRGGLRITPVFGRGTISVSVRSLREGGRGAKLGGVGRGLATGGMVGAGTRRGRGLGSRGGGRRNEGWLGSGFTPRSMARDKICEKGFVMFRALSSSFGEKTNMPFSKRSMESRASSPSKPSEKHHIGSP